MEPESVEIAEVIEDDQDYEHERPRRGITAGPIIAIVIVVLIVGVALIYTFSEPEVEEITILSPEYLTEGNDQRYGISMEIRVIGGMKTVEGTGSLDILFNGKTEFSEQVQISNDKGLAEVEFKDFVVENGKYSIVFSMDGVSEEIEYIATMVPYDLNLTYESSIYQLVARPLFEYPNGEAESISFYSPFYDFKVSIEDPDGSIIDEEKSMEEWNGQNRTISIIKYDLDIEKMGYHTLTVEFINNLVKTSSRYRKLTNYSFESTRYINRPPVLTVDDMPDRISRRQEASFSFSADDPDSNGRILYFNIDWGDQTSTEVMIDEGDQPDIDVTHTWQEGGDYTISVSCADNGPEDEVDPLSGKIIKLGDQMFDTEEIPIEVKLF